MPKEAGALLGLKVRVGLKNTANTIHTNVMHYFTNSIIHSLLSTPDVTKMTLITLSL